MRHSFLSMTIAAVLSAGPLAATSPVVAEPSSPLAQYKPTSPEARAHFEAGNRLYKSGAKQERPLADRVRDLRAAIAEYQTGAQLEDAPAFDYNLGHAWVALADTPTAVKHLQRFLDRAQPAEQVRASLEKEIVQLDPGGSIRADLRRASEEVKAPKTHVAPVASTVAEPQSSPRSVGQSPPRDDTASNSAAGSGPWLWVGGGMTLGGVVGGGIATWLAISASGLYNDARDTSRSSNERLALQDRADARRHAALFVGIGSGAAVVLGVATLLFAPRSSASAATSTSTAWNLGLTGNGLAVFGRF